MKYKIYSGRALLAKFEDKDDRDSCLKYFRVIYMKVRKTRKK